MLTFKDRMRVEHQELTYRIMKLHDFLWGEIFNGLDARDKELLVEQYAHMKASANALVERIARS